MAQDKIQSFYLQIINDAGFRSLLKSHILRVTLIKDVSKLNLSNRNVDGMKRGME